VSFPQHQPIVVDASLALKWVIQEPDSPRAQALLVNWSSERRDLLAPALFASEAGNALTQRMRLGQLDLPSAQRALRDLFVAVVIVPADAQLAERALELTQLLSLAVVYDAVYAALAEREGAEFWTADHRFYAAARPILPWVRFVAEAPSPPDAV